MADPPPPVGQPAAWPGSPAWPLPARPPRAERVLACIAHLGVPFGSVINPLVIWSINPTGSFARGHARQAFSYQCLYLPFHVVCTALMLFGPVAPLLICMTVGFLLEIPQLVRGSLGLPPLRLVPFTILGR